MSNVLLDKAREIVRLGAIAPEDAKLWALKRLEAEVSRLETALQGRTMSCSNCNQAAKELDAARRKIESLEVVRKNAAEMHVVYHEGPSCYSEMGAESNCPLSKSLAAHAAAFPTKEA